MKISNVAQITLPPVKYLPRDKFSKCIELPCLEACLKMYDLNIHTFSSGCNKVNYNNAHIALEYRYLSQENKEIADELVKNGLAKKNNYNGEDYIIIIIPTNLKDDVNDVSKKLLKIACMFSYQDVLYGFISLDEFKRKCVEFSHEFEDDDGKISPLLLGDLEGDLEDRKRKTLFFINECLQDAIDEGRVDLENGIVWENKELFNKHIAYLDEMRGLIKK